MKTNTKVPKTPFFAAFSVGAGTRKFPAHQARRDYLLYFLYALTRSCCGMSSSTMGGMSSALMPLPFCILTTVSRTASTTAAGATPRGQRSTQAIQERQFQIASLSSNTSILPLASRETN